MPLPPAAAQIHATLATQGPLSPREICEATGLSARTVRGALAHLREAGVVRRHAAPGDMRRRVYEATEAPP